MKKLLKTILCFVLAASLCLGMGLVTFADEASDVSLDDLLALLQQLAGDSGEDEGTEEVAGNVCTVGSVSFVVPDGMTDMSDTVGDGDAMFMADDMSAYLQASFFEAMEGENIDLTDETNQQLLLGSMADEGGEVTSFEVLEIAGHNALRFEMTAPEGVEKEGYIGYCLVLQLDNGIAPIQYISMDSGAADEFQKLIDSITIGEVTTTVSSGDPAPTVDPAPVSAEAIDATLVDDVVLVDNDVCKVAIKKFSTEDDYYAFTCKVYLENKTDDVNLYFSTDYEALNDYLCSAYFGETVAPGHKTNEELHFYRDDLEMNNITDIASLSFQLIVRDDDDWSADPYVKQFFTILPFGADVPAQPPQTFSDDAITLVDTNDVKMILTGFDDTDSYYFKANVYVENNTDKTLDFDLDYSSAINGYEIYPYLYAYVPAGKKANTAIEWTWDDLEENDIEYIEDIELAIEISDYDDYWADPIFEDTIYLTFE